jgi:hypothetical protein
MTVSLLAFGISSAAVSPAAAIPQSNDLHPTTVCGGLWHWVHNGLPAGVDSGTLTVVFDGGATVSVSAEFNGSVLHYNLDLDEGVTLVSAEDDVAGGMLLLSGWPSCADQQTTTSAPPVETTLPPTSSTTTSTSTTVVTTSPPTSVDTSVTTGGASASISVAVETVPAGSTQEFLVIVSAVSGDPASGWTQMMTHGSVFTVEGLDPGVYSVEEILPSAKTDGFWEQVGAECDGGHSPAEIRLEAGAVVGCRFTNALNQVAGSTVVSSTTTTADPDVSGAGTLPLTGLPTISLTVLGLASAGLGLSLVSYGRPRGRHERA